MADVSIEVTADQAAQVNTAQTSSALMLGKAVFPYISSPLTPPAGTYASGGPTRGQLMPVGHR